MCVHLICHILKAILTPPPKLILRTVCLLDLPFMESHHESVIRDVHRLALPVTTLLQSTTTYNFKGFSTHQINLSGFCFEVEKPKVKFLYINLNNQFLVIDWYWKLALIFIGSLPKLAPVSSRRGEALSVLIIPYHFPSFHHHPTKALTVVSVIVVLFVCFVVFYVSV